MRTLVSICAAVLACSLVGACDGKSDPDPSDGPDVPDAADVGQPDSGPPPVVPIHQTTTASTLPYPAQYGAPTTFRIPFTNMRAGTQVQVALWGQDGGMNLRGAYIGRYLGKGAVAENTPLTFAGSPSATIAPNAVLVSDPVPFATVSGERYAVSFAASGTIPESQDIANDGVRVSGERAGEADLGFGTQDPLFHGVKWVSVLGDRQRVIAVLGDSIGAGMAAMGTDTRFIAVAQKQLGYPVIDASEGGDGVERALFRMNGDVMSVPGITDVLVEIGTNDLHRGNPGGVEIDKAVQFITGGLSDIFRPLRGAGYKVWGATIVPKGKRADGSTILAPGGEETRRRVNAFIQSTDLVDGVVDFAAALADPADPSQPAPGMLHTDGIHPSTAGHAKMAEEMVKFFRAR